MKRRLLSALPALLCCTVLCRFAHADCLPLDLAEHFNNDGIGTQQSPDDGRFDAIGATGDATFNYRGEELPASNEQFVFADIPFQFGSKEPGGKNNIWTQGQVIDVPPQNFGELFVLGSSVNGSYRSNIFLSYDDGTSQAATLSLSDWCTNPQYGESVAVRANKRYNIPGKDTEPSPNGIFVQTIKVDAARKLTRIELPRNNSFHIFALTLCNRGENPRPLPAGPKVLPDEQTSAGAEIHSAGVVLAGSKAELVLKLPENVKESRLTYSGKLSRRNEKVMFAVDGVTTGDNPVIMASHLAKSPGLIDLSVSIRARDPKSSESVEMITTHSSCAVLPSLAEDRVTTAFYGTNAPLMKGDDENTTLIRLMKIAGIGAVREGFDWQDVEPQQGQWNFEKTDKAVEIAQRHGLEVYGLLCYWAGWSAAYTEEGYRQYANYARTVVSRYKGKVKYWEIWNEPNIFYWKKGPKEYAELLKIGHAAVKEANPDAIVCAPGTAGTPMDWIEEIFKLGAVDFLDAVSVHPYRMGGEYPEESRFLEEMEALRELMKKYGGENKRLIISEMGNATHPTGAGPSVTEQEQANTLVRTFLTAAAVPHMDMLLWYRFDDPGFESWHEHHFGIVEPFLNPKPAYVAHCTLTRLLPNPQFRRWVKRGPQVFAAEFDGGTSGTVTALWAKRDSVTMQVNVPAGLVEVNIMGLEKPMSSGPRKITDEPVFYVGNSSIRLEEQ